MLPEYLDVKKALLAALEDADDLLHERTSVYALLETLDPEAPFELALVTREGEESEDAQVMDERLFDRAFLDYGFHEVLDENMVEGVEYAPVEDLVAGGECIGVAPFSLFDGSVGRARMAREAGEDDAEESPASLRFPFFLELVERTLSLGLSPETLAAEELDFVVGLLFVYSAPSRDPEDAVVAFQRLQPSSKKKSSSLLVFGGEGSAPTACAAASIRLSSSFDFVLYGKQALFRTLSSLTTLFAYNKLLAALAKDYAETLSEVVADCEKLDERIDKSRSVATKLLKLRRKGCPVAEMEARELASKVSTLPYYNSKVRFDRDGKVILTTAAEVDDFLRLLEDPLLVSPVSGARYEARTKTLLDDEGE